MLKLILGACVAGLIFTAVLSAAPLLETGIMWEVCG